MDKLQNNSIIIDCLQYANWSPKIFKEMHEGGIDCIHVTIAYHENFRETVLNLEKWNEYFIDYSDLIFHASSFEDIQLSKDNLYPQVRNYVPL